MRWQSSRKQRLKKRLSNTNGLNKVAPEDALKRRAADLERDQPGGSLRLQEGTCGDSENRKTAEHLWSHNEEMKRKLNQSGGSTRDQDFEAFCRALPALMKTDPGLWVAFSGGRLIDKDPDEFALAERVARDHSGQRVLIQPVVESGMIDVYMDTRRFRSALIAFRSR